MSLPSQKEPEVIPYVSEANLAFFVHDRLSPVVARVSGAEAYPEAVVSFLRAELLEAFVWLHSGVKVGYFPSVLSRRVFYEHSHLFLRAYEALLEAKVIETWFPSPIRSIWESELTGRQQLFSSGEKWMDAGQSQGLLSTFQTLFLLANGFAQDAEARPFVEAFTLCSEADWAGLIGEDVQPPTMETLEPGDEAHFRSHRVSVGVLAVVEYMRAVRRATSDIRDSLPAAQISVVSLFVDLLKETQGWRLNFGFTTPRVRLLQAAEVVAREFVAQAGKGDITVSGVMQGFLKELEQLMRDWGAPQAAGAS